MTLFVTVLHVVICLLIIGVVLLQRGKGAEIGAVFGGGGGSTVFGSRGAGNFLTRLTAGAAAVFMVTSLTLAYFAQDDTERFLFDEEPAATAPASPFEETGVPAPPAEGAGAFEEVGEPRPAAESAPSPQGEAPEEPAPSP